VDFRLTVGVKINVEAPDHLRIHEPSGDQSHLDLVAPVDPGINPFRVGEEELAVVFEPHHHLGTKGPGKCQGKEDGQTAGKCGTLHGWL
jgi:hypothetical protein